MHTVEEAAAGGTSFAISEAASERYGELTEAYGTADNAAKALLTEAGYVWNDADVRFTSSTGGAMTFEIRLRTDEISGTSWPHGCRQNGGDFYKSWGDSYSYRVLKR